MQFNPLMFHTVLGMLVVVVAGSLEAFQNPALQCACARGITHHQGLMHLEDPDGTKDVTRARCVCNAGCVGSISTSTDPRQNTSKLTSGNRCWKMMERAKVDRWQSQPGAKQNNGVLQCEWMLEVFKSRSKTLGFRI